MVNLFTRSKFINAMKVKLSSEILKFHRLKSQRVAKPDVPMRFVQFRRARDRHKHLGAVSEDGEKLVPLSKDVCCSSDMITFISQGMHPTELVKKIKAQPVEPVEKNLTLLPPVTNPEKIICMGPNYVDHIMERNLPQPKEPVFFSKYASSLIGPTGNVIAHRNCRKIDWEVELAVIIGKEAKNVSKARALDFVFGYCVAQDISARDWLSKHDGGLLIGKSMDTFCPLGPSIVHKSLIKNPHDLQIITRVNGVIKQNGNTKNMIYRVEDIISTLSRNMTLKPGDVILTGTPAGVGMCKDPPEYLKPGDVLESEIQSIGKLINEVVVDNQNYDSCVTRAY